MATTDISQKDARRRVDMFKHEYDRGIYLLGCHAALPVVLNTELLHLIRVNFFLDTSEPLSYTEESDLLLSQICQEIGADLYEIDSEVRNILLQELVNEYGHERVREVAALLWQYTDQRSPWEDHIRLKRAQQLTALNFLNPKKAQKWLGEAEESSDYSESGLKDWFVAMYRETGRRGNLKEKHEFLTPDLYYRCRSVLLKCGEFDSNASLLAVFVTDELSPFRDGWPETASKTERVDKCLDYLLSKFLSNNRPVLPLFLAALRGR